MSIMVIELILSMNKEKKLWIDFYGNKMSNGIGLNLIRAIMGSNSVTEVLIDEYQFRLIIWSLIKYLEINHGAGQSL